MRKIAYIVFACVAALSPESQSVILKAFIQRRIHLDCMSPQVRSFLSFHIYVNVVSMPVHALIATASDRHDPSLVDAICQLTRQSRSVVKNLVTAWGRFCIDEKKCEPVSDVKMRLTRDGLTAYLLSAQAALPPVEERMEVDSWITEYMVSAPDEMKLQSVDLQQFLTVPGWMFRLMEFNRKIPLLELVDLIYAFAEPPSYSWEETRLVAKLWRNRCILPRSIGVIYLCHVDASDNWHLNPYNPPDHRHS